MKKLLVLLVILSTAFAACNNDMICQSSETKACSDCTISGEAQCYEDGVCTAEEKELGNCSDCMAKSSSEATGETSSESLPSVPVTGLVVLGGISFFSIGFFVVIGLVIAFFMLRGKGNNSPLSG